MVQRWSQLLLLIALGHAHVQTLKAVLAIVVEVLLRVELKVAHLTHVHLLLLLGLLQELLLLRLLVKVLLRLRLELLSLSLIRPILLLLREDLEDLPVLGFIEIKRVPRSEIEVGFSSEVAERLGLLGREHPLGLTGRLWLLLRHLLGLGRSLILHRLLLHLLLLLILLSGSGELLSLLLGKLLLRRVGFLHILRLLLLLLLLEHKGRRDRGLLLLRRRHLVDRGRIRCQIGHTLARCRLLIAVGVGRLVGPTLGQWAVLPV